MASVFVQVAYPDGGELIVVWSVDGTASLTNQVALSSPSTPAEVSFTNFFGLGSHSVGLKVIDPQSCEATCSTTLTILMVNTAPVANPDNYTVNEGGTLSEPAGEVPGVEPASRVSLAT